MEFSDYHIRRERICKKNVLEFRRNNLSADSFKDFYGVLRFEEESIHRGLSCKISIRIREGGIDSLFRTEFPKGFRVSGSRNHFGVIVRLNETQFPGDYRCINDTVRVEITLSGRLNGYKLFQKQKPRKADKYRDFPIFARCPGEAAPMTVPPSVSWAAMHPLQGGRISPR